MAYIDKKRFGKFIAHRRNSIPGVKTQLKLAEKLEVSNATIGKIETGDRLPSFELLLDLALALEMTPGALVDEMAGIDGAEGDLQDGRFIALPPHFTQEDYDFLAGAINFIAATYERTERNLIHITGRIKEPEPLILGQLGEPYPDPWITTNEKHLLEHIEALRWWLASLGQVS